MAQLAPAEAEVVIERALSELPFQDWTIIDTRRSKPRIVRKSFRVNVYSYAELKRLLTTAGFKIESVWGMLPGGRFDPKTTWHQTILARKPSTKRRVSSRVRASSSRR